MLCLDNSVLAKFARPNPDPNVISSLEAYAGDPWAVPVTVLFEYLRYYSSASAVRAQHHELTAHIERVLPLTEAVAVEAVLLEQSLADQGVRLDLGDLLHAAIARERGATLITCDSDFDRGPVRDLLDVDVVAPIE